MGYNCPTNTIQTTDVFDTWFAKQDTPVRFRVDARIRSVAMGNFGDNKSVGDGVYELRIHMRSGIRIYYMRRGIEVVVLLAGGNKDSQKKDIEIARKLSARIKDE